MAVQIPNRAGQAIVSANSIASVDLSLFLQGKKVFYAYVTDILRDGTSTGTMVIEFTDGSTFAISEGGQAGYMEYDMFPANGGLQVQPSLAADQRGTLDESCVCGRGCSQRSCCPVGKKYPTYLTS